MSTVKFSFQVFLLIFFAFVLTKINGKFEFTNLKCTSLDKQFVEFESCYLKSINRTYKFLTIKAKLLKLPLENLTIHVEVLKRLNGYKPFLYNFKVDACRFLSSQRNSVTQYFYDFFASYSNMTHRCPYNHDLTVEKLPISHMNHMVTNVLPVPEGNYLVHSVWTVNGKKRCDIKVYVSIN
ncbi:uncharacterized protein LOC124459818 [Drosophila willistoni]|uniref:uncharacterized protein LOC124459818 n=1 Tax=Drosophila willistoni TaxID=7260 RepID=UPI001F078642|nr:uncharacterized protein LOC124459818 [Drosophila willistoni]